MQWICEAAKQAVCDFIAGLMAWDLLRILADWRHLILHFGVLASQLPVLQVMYIREPCVYRCAVYHRRRKDARCDTHL